MGVRKPEKMSSQESASVLNCDLDIKAYLLLSWMIIWREPWSCVDEQQPTKCCPAAADLLYGGTVDGGPTCGVTTPCVSWAEDSGSTHVPGPGQAASRIVRLIKSGSWSTFSQVMRAQEFRDTTHARWCAGTVLPCTGGKWSKSGQTGSEKSWLAGAGHWPGGPLCPCRRGTSV